MGHTAQKDRYKQIVEIFQRKHLHSHADTGDNQRKISRRADGKSNAENRREAGQATGGSFAVGKGNNRMPQRLTGKTCQPVAECQRKNPHGRSLLLPAEGRNNNACHQGHRAQHEAVLIPLAGCGAFQTQMAKTTTKMARLSSFHTDVDLVGIGTAKIGEDPVRLKIRVTGGMDIETDPVLIKVDGKLAAFGQEWDLQFYIQKDYDTLSFYPYASDRIFDRLSQTEAVPKRAKTVQALKLLIKCGDYFLDGVPDTINGVSVKRYDGYLPKELVDQALVLLDLKDEEENASAVPAPAAGHIR